MGLAASKVDAVVFGGDLLPMPTSVNTFASHQHEFITSVLRPAIEDFRGRSNALIYLMLGNDDASGCVEDLESLERDGLSQYIHMKAHDFGEFFIYGYSKCRSGYLCDKTKDFFPGLFGNIVYR